MKNKLNAIVMSGGKGTRFWPVSTSTYPKQYLNLIGQSSLLENSLDRLEGLIEPENRYIVTTVDQKNLVEKNSKNKIKKSNGIILEPSGRNTAPCILLSIAHLISEGLSNDDIVAILPSDHVVQNTEKFKESLDLASKTASESNNIVTIGINPSKPHTGYGYIHKGDQLGDKLFPVKSFVEKPDLDTAKAYVESGDYFWNAGIFVASLKTLLNEFKEHAPEIYNFFDKLLENINNDDELAKVYNQIPSDSIDYAVMEKSSNVIVVEATFDWNDLGSWDALEGVLDSQNENINVNAKSVNIINSKGNIIFGKNKNVALIDVNDLVVVEHNGTLLIMPKNSSQKVKNLVEALD